MKSMMALALYTAVMGSALAHNDTRDYRTIVPNVYSQSAPASRPGPTTANPDTSIPDRISAPEGNVRQSPAVTGE
jgi:hypothetical protein